MWRGVVLGLYGMAQARLPSLKDIDECLAMAGRRA